MIGFFIGATGMLLIALGLVVYPLMRAGTGSQENQSGDVIALSRERLEELKAKKQAGELSETEYTEQVSDLEAQLADDLRAQSKATESRDTGGGRWIGIATMAFIPILSGLLYLALGKPQALIPELVKPPMSASQPTASDIDAMVAGLANRLKEEPDDPQGWLMLGRSYMVLNRYEEAAGAFARLRELVGNEPNVLLQHASALALSRSGDLTGDPERLVKLALDQQPNNPQGLWMAATAAYQKGEFETAAEYYKKVEPMVEGEQLEQVKGVIQDLAAKGFGQTSVADATPQGKTTASVEVNVMLDPAVRDKAGPQDTVFIFAKAVNGPPMPLAVVRKKVSDLPLTVTLDDSQAMTPQFKLSSFDQATIGARISSSGNAISQPGDLEGESPPVSTDTSKTVDITINRVVPE